MAELLDHLRTRPLQTALHLKRPQKLGCFFRYFNSDNEVAPLPPIFLMERGRALAAQGR
jgi:hypothetical protein